MLRVFKVSGEEAFSFQLEDFEQPVRVLAVKRRLEVICGRPRFTQRLLLWDGQMLSDDFVLDGPVDIQLVLQPFEESSQDQIRQLQKAASDNNIPVLEQLLQRPVDPDLDLGRFTPMHVACGRGNIEAARLLMEAKADKDKGTNDGETPMFAASLKGHLDVVQLLLEAKADKDKAKDEGTAPLLVASHEGRTEVVRLLIDANADKDTADKTGTTPMIAAAWKGHLAIVRLLLDANADKDKAESSGATPMVVASWKGHFEVVRLLLEAKANADKATDGDMTPMFVATQQGHVEIVQLLHADKDAGFP